MRRDKQKSSILKVESASDPVDVEEFSSKKEVRDQAALKRFKSISFKERLQMSRIPVYMSFCPLEGRGRVTFPARSERVLLAHAQGSPKAMSLKCEVFSTSSSEDEKIL